MGHMDTRMHMCLQIGSDVETAPSSDRFYWALWQPAHYSKTLTGLKIIFMDAAIRHLLILL